MKARKATDRRQPSAQNKQTAKKTPRVMLREMAITVTASAGGTEAFPVKRKDGK